MGSSQSNKQQHAYVGRFAPSPTGPLHLGSLIAALASYLDARANAGTWLVRMEDLDPPREPPGAAEQILEQLHKLGLHWDGDVLYQSQRQEAYARALTMLQTKRLSYPCDCSRQQVRAMGSVYSGLCRNRLTPPTDNYAIRVRTTATPIEFIDIIQGRCEQNIEAEVGDFIIRRKDGLFAYQLAVVVDDAYQGVTHVVRGYDLLSSTARQVYLQQLLGLPTPRYAHIPVIVNDEGEKLSKQRFADPIDTGNAPRLIHESLKYLGQRPPANQVNADVTTQLQWACDNWDIQCVPKLANIPQLND